MNDKINVNPLLKRENSIPIEVDYQILSLTDEDLEGLSATSVKNLSLKGNIEMRDGVIKFAFELAFLYTAECARCDKGVEREIDTRDEKVITLSADEDNGYETDSFASEDGILDLHSFAVEFVSLSLPYRELCKPDCKGLCPICGKDLNEEKCDCDKNKKNPAFAKLDGFFEKE